MSYESGKTKKYFKPTMTQKKVKLMHCTHLNCDNVFEAHSHARFCEFHKNPATRKVTKKKDEISTFIFKHNFKEVTTIQRNCDCCRAVYELDIYPGGGAEYPRFCELHRSEYKRKYWREQHGEE